ncbi:MAG: PAS domain S-box protein [Actinomycetota bacterium]|nr:PAS domain S-box protein [Actinomycetota bacterium]
MRPATATGGRAGCADALIDAMVEALPVAVVAVDAESRIAHVNAAAERLFGYRREHVVGEVIHLLLPEGHPAAGDVLADYVQHPRSSVVTTVVECTGRRGDGTEFSLEVTLTPLGLSDGSGVLLSIQPGTKNQEVAERLAILEAFVETSEDAVFSHAADGRITSWNRSSERIFGYPKEEILGQGSTILFPDHLREEAKLVFDTVAAGDRVDRFETEIQRKDGMPIPILLSLCPLFEADGKLVASVLIARDVTEQRLAQATLAEIESRVREAEALAHVGSWLWDVRSGAVQWTDELHRIHGIDPLDFEGTFDAHVARIHPDDQERVRGGLEECIDSGRSFEDEYRIVRPDGELRWMYVRAEPTIGSAGGVVGFRGIGQDITRLAPDPSPRHPA